MRTSSFDIFDTCVVRKCGHPKNLFDILSYEVFQGVVSTECRLEFVVHRLAADESSTFEHLYDSFSYEHPQLVDKERIKSKELECEQMMILPVKAILDKVNQCRENGDHIVFISDMYLPTDFLRKVLCGLGFLKDGDSIYVSGDCGHCKADGSLYRLIKKQEGIEYNSWQHFGDNLVSDIQMPSKLGIKTYLINHKYLPYEELWKDNSNDITFPVGGIMAGIGRGLMLSMPNHEHNAFALDIAAPLMVTFAMRIMTDASKRGIKRLYFCSRDCYALYQVALKLTSIIPSIEPIYFHTSRKALYNTTKDKLVSYLIHIGMACYDGQVGIVDMRSTGNSLKYLNELFEEKGFRPVFGYYFEMFCSDCYTNVSSYYCEINRLYCKLFSRHHPILEKFLSLSPEGETVGYENNEPVIESRREKEDYFVSDIDSLSTVNLTILLKYTDCFLGTELHHYYNEVFCCFVIPTLKHFFNSPNKDYLLSLRKLFILNEDGTCLPYIDVLPSGISLRIALIAKESKIRFVRRLMKLIMRTWNIKPLPKELWWLEGTRVYNHIETEEE